MKLKLKKCISLFITFVMITTILGGNLFNSSPRAFAKEEIAQSATVNDVIKLLTDEISKKGKAADKDEKIVLYKAGVTSIDKANVIKEFDPAPKYLGTKVTKACAIMDLDEDPSAYDGKDLIKDIADEVSKLQANEKTRFFGNETRAIELLDRFNKKYPDKKVDYNTENAMKFLLYDLGSTKGSLNVPHNVALGLKVFLNHTDIAGVQDAATQCKKLLHDWQIQDGSLSTYKDRKTNEVVFSITQHIPAVQKLEEIGEKLDSVEWTKGDKNAIDALFNSWDGKQFTNSYGKDNTAYKNVLNALLSLKVAGYGEYAIKGAKFDNIVNEDPKEQAKKSCNVKVRVEANDHTIVPLTELVADNFDLSPYGGSKLDEVVAINAVIKALENSGIDCKDINKFGKYSNIENIDGLKTKSTGENDGWMYYVNNTYAPVVITDYKIKDGDSIVMFFQEDYNKIIYSWFDKEQANIKTGENLTLKLNGSHYDMNADKTVKSPVNDAKILVDNKETTVSGKKVLTDKDGNAVLKFDKAGTYTISAERFDSQTKKRDITRPYCKVVVEQGEATEVNKDKELQNIINEVLGYYNGWVDNNNKSFDYITTLALRRAGMDTDTLNKKINIYSMENLHSSARNVMTLIGANSNPKNYKNKDYVLKLMLNDFTKEKDSEYIAKSVIALDMAKANYDKGKSINLLLSKAHDEKDGKISYGSMQTSDDGAEKYTADLTATCWTLIALSNHKDVDKSSSTIDGIKKYLKANQKENGLIDNCTNTALLIQGLIALGENPLDDYWCIKNESNKITLVDAILKCKYKSVFGEYPSSNMMGEYATPHAFAALTDLNLNSSMYRELSFKEVGGPVKLVIDGDKVINLCKGQYSDLTAKAYDCNNLAVKDSGISWKSSDDKIVTVKNGTLTALSEGEAEITAYISENENIKDTVKIKVSTNECKQTVIDALNKACDSMSTFSNSSQNWECAAVGLSRADRKDMIPKDYLNSLETLLKDPKNISYYDTAPLEYERMILKVLSMGGNPKNIADINLVEKVYNSNLEAQKMNSLVYGLIALDAGHYTIPSDAKWNRESIIKAILDKESTSGGWSYNKGSKGNPEVTGTVLLGLSPYYSSNDNVKKAIDKAVEFLSTSQNEKGKYATSSYSGASSKISSQVIIGLCANGIDPTSDKFTKKDINLVDALITFQKDNGGFIDKEATFADATWLATEQAICALTQYKYFVEKKGSIYDFGDRNNDGIDEKQTNTIKIEGNKIIEIYKGQAIDFIAKVYDKNNAVVNKVISWKSSNDKIACIHSKDIIAVSEGETEITAYMTDNEKVKDTIKIKVILPSKLGYDKVIKNEIDFLKEHYKPYGSYEFLASPAAAIAGVDKNEIGSNILRYSSNDVGIYNARVIVALLGAGLDPRNDVVKGTKNNYVEILEKSQRTEGKDKGKFIINEFADSDAITTQSYSIIALDLAGGKYDEQSAVKTVLEMLNDKNYKNSPSYHSLKTEAVSLMALAKHKDIEGAQAKIDELLKFIKSNQNEYGGFDIAAGSTFLNSPVATGAVVTALYTLGIDPMSAEWTKNGNTVIDSIVRNKVVKNDLAIGGYAQGEELYFENYEATYYAFATFVQLQNKKSIFDMMDKVEKPQIIEKKLQIENITKQTQFNKNSDAKVTIRVTNTSESDQNVTLIVGLFDKDGKLINYVAAIKNVKSGESGDLIGMIKTPDSNGNTIKAFVWDSLDIMNSLSDVIEVPIK